jgi:hypothetical protein
LGGLRVLHKVSLLSGRGPGGIRVNSSTTANPAAKAVPSGVNDVRLGKKAGNKSGLKRQRGVIRRLWQTDGGVNNCQASPPVGAADGTIGRERGGECDAHPDGGAGPDDVFGSGSWGVAPERRQACVLGGLALLFARRRRGGRVAEGDGLLNRLWESNPIREFESRPLRSWARHGLKVPDGPSLCAGSAGVWVVVFTGARWR